MSHIFYKKPTKRTTVNPFLKIETIEVIKSNE